MIKKKLAVLLVPAVLLLGGCISTSEPVQVEHFTLAGAPPAASAQTAPANRAQAASILRIADVNAPHWLDSANMYYRLAYQNRAKVAAYSRSDWAAPPPAQLENILAATLAASGQYKAIIGPSDVANADLTLRIELDDFEQIFTSQNQSAGVLDATATVIGSAGKIVAQRHFHIEKPAPSADAVGGVKALSAASQAFASQVQNWLAKVTANQG